MRRFSLFALVVVVALAGCTKKATEVVYVTVEKEAKPTTPEQPNTNDTPRGFNALVDKYSEATPQEKYDANLLRAGQLIAERKYDDAIEALEAAQASVKTPQVEKELERVKALAARQRAAQKTLDDLKTILAEGKAEEAAKLATQALANYGDTDLAEQFAVLKRQADALVGLGKPDADARFTQFKTDGDAAFKDKNLRSALLSYEQALVVREDVDLKKQVDQLRADLKKYDDCRQKSLELRSDPLNLEEALAQLEEARKAWDTLEVQQQIADCKLALQTRRDRLAVVEFEVRGDTGIASAGRTIAEELLPHFKTRFDLVERGQLDKVLQELKLEPTALATDEAGRNETCKIGKVRYLVVGSVSRISGIVVHARLIDVKTGLVVQAGRVEGATPEEVVKLLPRLARVLMMSDDQKVAFEQELLKQEQTLKPIVPAEQLPTIPEAVLPTTPPPPIVASTPQAPEFGDLTIKVFDNLVVPPQGQQPPPPVIVIERENPLKRKMLFLHLEMGDNLYRRGCYRDAFTHFEIALLIAPDQRDIALRYERCRDRLAGPIVISAKPKIAILDFLPEGNPRVVPRWLGPWTAEQIAPYFCQQFEIVDRNTLNWYLRRLGVTVCDLMTDAATRRWVGRALGVRYFLFGTLRESTSFKADAYLVDVEYGCKFGEGHIHVRDPHELKLCLPELARLTLMSPIERARCERERIKERELLENAARARKEGKFAVAIEILGDARKKRPFSVEIQVLFESTNEQARQIALRDARDREYRERQALAIEQQKRQRELAEQAEQARIRAEQEARARADADRIAQEQRRQAAYKQLTLQAQVALEGKNFKLSIELYQSAVQMRPCDESHQNLALARSRHDQWQRAQQAEALALREQQLREQRERELAQARQQLEAERQQRAAQEEADRAARKLREDALYARLYDEGERALAKRQYDAAIASLQAARQVKATPEVEKLLKQATEAQSNAVAEKQGRDEKLKQQLAEEKRKREAAEAEAKKNRELYQEALKLARLAMQQRKYEEAIAGYKKAQTLFPNDEVLTGLREAEQGRKQEAERIAAEAKRKADEEKKATRIAQLLNDGNTALKAQDWDKAKTSFAAVTKLDPGNVEALTGISKADTGKAEAVARAQRQADEQKANKVKAAVARAQQAIKTGQWDQAEKELAEAVKIAPQDPGVVQAVADIQAGRKGAATAMEQQKIQAAFDKAMDDGKKAAAAGKWDDAIGHFAEAKKLKPNDPQAEAERLKVVAAKDAATKEGEKKVEIAKLMKTGNDALKAQKYDDAITAFQAVLKLAPNDAEALAGIATAQKAKANTAQMLEAQKIQAAFDKAMDDGKKAAAAGKWDDALGHFAEAKKFKPNDPQAEAERLKAVAAKDAATKEGEKKTEIAKLMKAGNDALKVQKYDDAITAFQAVLKLAPNDTEALAGIATAQKAKANTAQMLEAQKIQAAFDKAMDDGKKAATAGKWDDAVKAFSEAKKLKPADTQAGAELTKAQAAQAAEAKKADYARFMQAGQTALKANKPDEALKQFQAALQVVPNDVAANKGIADAQQMIAAMKAEMDKQKTKQAYDAAMARGQQALKTNKFAEAIAAFTEAGKLIPNDPMALAQLKAAQKAQADAMAADMKQKEEAAKKAKIAELNTKAQTAMQAKRYQEAIQAYQQVLQLDANDATAKAGLPVAKKALDDATKPPPPPPPGNDYDKQIKAAVAAVNAGKYADAVQAYQDALKAKPGDAPATTGLKFAKHMNDGITAFNAKKFPEAEKEFDQALKIDGNNQDAKRWLQRAKQRK